MVADLKQWHQFLFESASEHVKQDFKEKYKVSEYSVNISFPHEIVDFDDGIGFFYNPDKGQEIMLNFNSLISGMHNKGKNLSEDEEDTIRQFIQSDAISPRFVRMVADEYGSESVAVAFLIRDLQNDYYLE